VQWMVVDSGHLSVESKESATVPTMALARAPDSAHRSVRRWAGS
jgi:hypothetical protein